MMLGMNDWILIALLLLVNLANSTILVVLPVSNETSLRSLLQQLSVRSFLISFDILACNCNFGNYDFDSSWTIGDEYYSNVLCNNFINEMTSIHNHDNMVEAFRLELLRPSFIIRNDIDVILSTMMRATLVVFDSSLVNDKFNYVVDSLMRSTLIRTEVTHEYVSNSSFRVWKHTQRPVHIEGIQKRTEESKYMDDESRGLLRSLASNASEHWKAGLYPDRDCNCGLYRDPKQPTCYDLHEDTRLNLQRFKVHQLSPQETTEESRSVIAPKKLLLCMVYTITTRHNNIRAIVDTWGKRCDGFIAWSNDTDTGISAVHLYNIRLEGQESYNTMWYKVMNIWEMMVLSKLIEEYEYFYLCGDDVYVIVNNLRQYLTSPFMQRRSGKGSRPVYLGRKVQHNHYLHYATGESGYVLNARAVEMLHAKLPSLECFNDLRVSMEDVMVGNCMMSALGIEPMDTRDCQGNERFNTWGVADLYERSFFLNRFEGHMKNVKVGLSSYSEYSIAFHLMTPNDYMYCVDGYFQSITPA